MVTWEKEKSKHQEFDRLAPARQTILTADSICQLRRQFNFPNRRKPLSPPDKTDAGFSPPLICGARRDDKRDFELKTNQVVSANLQAARWQSNVSPRREKLCRLQIETVEIAESFAAQYKILDAGAVAGLRKIETAAPPSPLVRGIGYAAERLLTESRARISKRNQQKSAQKLKSLIVKNSQR